MASRLRGSPNLLDEDCARQAERHAGAATLDAHGHRALELALAHDLEARAGQEVAPLQLAKPSRVVVRDALHDDFLAEPAFAERPVAERPHLAREGRDGVTVGI